MKSMSQGGIAGNVKLRGKLSKTLSCRCCDLRNFKPAYFKKLAEHEMKNSRSDSSRAKA
jgi:hypothetical protein